MYVRFVRQISLAAEEKNLAAVFLFLAAVDFSLAAVFFFLVAVDFSLAAAEEIIDRKPSRVDERRINDVESRAAACMTDEPYDNVILKARK